MSGDPPLIVIRVVTPADARLLDDHDAAVAEESRRHRGRPDPCASGDGGYVALLDGEPVGSLTYTSDASTRNVVRCHVDAEIRGIGVGDALMERFIADARGSGCTSVGATALPGDRETKNLCERNGLVARLILMERRLD